MNISYTKQPDKIITKLGIEIAPGTLFTAQIGGLKPELYFKTCYSIACLSNVGRSYSGSGENCGSTVKFQNYREHKDHELIVRD